jgi:putative restriction endonuclease
MATFLFVTKPEQRPERVQATSAHWWSCSRTTKSHDHALVYVTGVGILYEWRTTSDAEPNAEWKYICGVKHVRTFDPPIALRQILEEVRRSEWPPPYLKFRGFRSIEMPEPVAARIRALRRRPDDELKEDIDAIANSSLSVTEKQRLIQTRLGQGLFRMRVMRQWKFCPVTGCKLSLLLRASHIKPWRDSTNKERLDGFNGLLLAPNVDAAFDRGLLSFDERGRILFSRLLPPSEAKRLGIGRTARLKLSVRHLPYLAEHRRKHGFPA